METAGAIAVLACVIGAANKALILRATNKPMYARSARTFAMVAVVGVAVLGATALAWAAV